MNHFRYCPMCGGRVKWRLTEKRKRLICLKCKWVKYQNPLPVGVALVKDEEGKILLIKRGVPPYKGRWALPGGFIEAGEKSEEGCLRELEEETGIKGEIIKLIGVYHQKCRLYGDILTIAYQIKSIGGKIEPKDDAQGIKFVYKDKLPTIPFKSHIKAILKLDINS